MALPPAFPALTPPPAKRRLTTAQHVALGARMGAAPMPPAISPSHNPSLQALPDDLATVQSSEPIEGLPSHERAVNPTLSPVVVPIIGVRPEGEIPLEDTAVIQGLVGDGWPVHEAEHDIAMSIRTPPGSRGSLEFVSLAGSTMHAVDAPPAQPDDLDAFVTIIGETEDVLVPSWLHKDAMATPWAEFAMSSLAPYYIKGNPRDPDWVPASLCAERIIHIMDAVQSIMGSGSVTMIQAFLRDPLTLIGVPDEALAANLQEAVRRGPNPAEMRMARSVAEQFLQIRDWRTDVLLRKVDE